jgi:uncharacterized protein YqjF (DUF2071 family)
VAHPLFRADWCDMFFVHFALSPGDLQKHVPLELDLKDGDAFVSLVAFTQKRLRPVFGGRLASVLLAPLAEHEFLNLRTYVRVGERRGIYFLSEWIPNRLAQFIGPRTYGLPYHLARLRYRNTIRHCRGEVMARAGRFAYSTSPGRDEEGISAPRGSLEEFLLERSVAFTCHRDVVRSFEVNHAPWRYVPASVERLGLDLVATALPGIGRARVVAAEFSTGAFDVEIGRPEIVRKLRAVCGFRQSSGAIESSFPMQILRGA